VLLPEVVALGEDGRRWLQPQFVYAPLLCFAEGDARAQLWIAALDHSRNRARGFDCTVTFRRSDLVSSLPDHGQVFRCEISSAHSPAELAVGRARRRPDGGLDVKVHHHTTRESLALIHGSGYVHGSRWNYQGTRELTNIGYAYFTNLRSIRTEGDLRAMAMASDGRLGLQLDTTHGPTPDLVLEVYRASTRDRTATLTLWVASEAIATPHIWQHIGPPVHYEIAHPWTYRVGLQPGSHLTFRRDRATLDPASARAFDYAVIGDCTTIAGLEAPYDEENTTETFTVQALAGSNVFDFWRLNANTNLHAAATVVQAFAKPPG
jgi:hypothetical protein